MTRAGRRTHPHVAAQAAFGPDVDPLVERLIAPGPVRERLDEVAAQAPFATSLELVVREMLSLSVAHSKSAVPAAVLDDRPALRRLMQRVVFTDLADCAPAAGSRGGRRVARSVRRQHGPLRGPAARSPGSPRRAAPTRRSPTT